MGNVQWAKGKGQWENEKDRLENTFRAVLLLT